MDNIVAKRLKSEIKIVIVIAIVSSALLLSAIFISGRVSDLNEKAAMREQDTRKYRKLIGEDVEALIKVQDSVGSDLKQYYRNLESSFNKSHLKDTVLATSLSFKQMLFDVYERITEKAKRNAVLIPQDLGFEEYRLKVPDVSLVPVLTGELVFLEDITSLLIENKVSALISVKLPHKVTLLNKKTQSVNDVPFKSLSLQLSVETDFKQLKNFLLDLAVSDKTYVIRQFDIKKVDNTSERLMAYISLVNLEL